MFCLILIEFIKDIKISQTNLIVPTTLLSAQHYRSLHERFDAFGIKCSKLDRFVSAKDKKNIIKALGGDIVLESKEGVGTTVSFSLEMGVKNWGEKIEPIVVEKNRSFLNTLQGVQILLVEDNEVNQLVASMMLEKVGIEVTIASNGQEGVDTYLANPEKFDLILMDLQMPILSGYDATKKIREHNKTIPIIALTAAAMIEDKQKALEAGMDDHLSKPIEKEKMYQTIEGFVRSA